MSDQDAIAALIPIVTQVSGQMVTLTSEIGDVKANVAEVKATGEATLEQATKTNGRMNAAEAEIDALQQVVALKNYDDAARSKREAQDLARRLAWQPLIVSAGLGGFITIAGGAIAHFLLGVG